MKNTEILQNIDRAIARLQEAAETEQKITGSQYRESEYIRALVLLQQRRTREENKTSC